MQESEVKIGEERGWGDHVGQRRETTDACSDPSREAVGVSRLASEHSIVSKLTRVEGNELRESFALLLCIFERAKGRLSALRSAITT